MIPKDGLGRELGFGTEYGAVVGYSAFEASLVVCHEHGTTC